MSDLPLAPDQYAALDTDDNEDTLSGDVGLRPRPQVDEFLVDYLERAVAIQSPEDAGGVQGQRRALVLGKTAQPSGSSTPAESVGSTGALPFRSRNQHMTARQHQSDVSGVGKVWDIQRPDSELALPGPQYRLATMVSYIWFVIFPKSSSVHLATTCKRLPDSQCEALMEHYEADVAGPYKARLRASRRAVGRATDPQVKAVLQADFEQLCTMVRERLATELWPDEYELTDTQVKLHSVVRSAWVRAYGKTRATQAEHKLLAAVRKCGKEKCDQYAPEIQASMDQDLRDTRAWQETLGVVSDALYKAQQNPEEAGPDLLAQLRQGHQTARQELEALPSRLGSALPVALQLHEH